MFGWSGIIKLTPQQERELARRRGEQQRDTSKRDLLADIQNERNRAELFLRERDTVRGQARKYRQALEEIRYIYGGSSDNSPTADAMDRRAKEALEP